jgi:hypothetical protein
MTFDPRSEALKDRYMQLFEIGDFKSLHKDEIGRLAFGVLSFGKTEHGFYP